MVQKCTILGSGAMATACAILLAENPGMKISLWGRNEEFTAQFQKNRENRRQLPGITIPERVEVTSDIEQAMEGAELLVAAIPTQFLRGVLEKLRPNLGDHLPTVSVIKGLENETLLRPSEIIKEVLGHSSVVALGGPSHAEEIARRLPAGVVAASDDLELARDVQNLFTTDRFRVYTNRDLVGVELAGALKNVIAISAGICDGLKFGDNAKSGLMTRGLVEITRFGLQFGAEEATFHGLAGIGDLITTCVSPFGRNRLVGEKLGKGETLEQITQGMQNVAEGVKTTRSVYDLSVQSQVEMPITAEIYQVLFQGKSPLEATNSLMLRPPKDE